MPPDRNTPFPTSLCHRCQHSKRVHSGRGSQFLLCGEPSLPRYLPQPVQECAQFRAED